MLRVFGSISMMFMILFGYRLDMNLSKDSIYLKEPLVATFTFDSNSSDNIDKIQKYRLKYSRDWVIKFYDEINYKRGFIQRYIFIPTRYGDIPLPKYKVDIYQTDKESYLSIPKSLVMDKTISVSNISDDIDFVGNLKMDYQIDKNITTTNQTVKLNITLSGYGNMDSIDIKIPQIEGVTVYKAKPKVESKILKDGEFGGSWSINITLISDSSYTIPPIIFRYFNTSTDTIELLSTKKIDIEVSNPILVKQNRYIAISLIFGIFLGTVLTLVWIYIKPHKLISIKRFDDKTLHNQLLPYIYNKEVADIVVLLEDNIYRNRNHKIDYKKLKNLLEKVTD